MDSWPYLIRCALEDESIAQTGLWTEDLRNTFLLDDPKFPELKPFESIARQLTYLGIPARPYCNLLARRLEQWDECGAFPFPETPFPLLVEKPIQTQRRLTLASSIKQLLAGPRNVGAVVSFLKSLDARDLLTILGLRYTEGSQDVLPPSLAECISAFMLLHTDETEVQTNSKAKPSKLTVGARAFAKHSHRDSSASWWGTCTGSEAAKNQSASNIILKILSDVTWMNVHQLPQSLATFEVRHRDGYGARWVFELVQPPPMPGCIQLYKNVVFRGFLEPQMEGGHENAWRH